MTDTRYSITPCKSSLPLWFKEMRTIQTCSDSMRTPNIAFFSDIFNRESTIVHELTIVSRSSA